MKNKIDLQTKINIKNQDTGLNVATKRRGTRGLTYINNTKDFSMRQDASKVDLKGDAMNKSIMNRLNPIKILEQEESIMQRTSAKRTSRNSRGTSKARKSSTTPVNDGNTNIDDRNKFLNQLSRHAESINGRMGDLLKRSERLNDNAKRLSNQIDSMLKE